MSEPPLVQEIRQGAMWIRLNRPEAMNSLTPQLLAGLSAALDEAQARDEVKAIVLTGAGRAFCAGADLKFVRAGGNDRRTSLHEGPGQIVPKPVTAILCLECQGEGRVPADVDPFDRIHLNSYGQRHVDITSQGARAT